MLKKWGGCFFDLHLVACTTDIKNAADAQRDVLGEVVTR